MASSTGRPAVVAAQQEMKACRRIRGTEYSMRHNGFVAGSLLTFPRRCATRCSRGWRERLWPLPVVVGAGRLKAWPSGRVALRGLGDRTGMGCGAEGRPGVGQVIRGEWQGGASHHLVQTGLGWLELGVIRVVLLQQAGEAGRASGGCAQSTAGNHNVPCAVEKSKWLGRCHAVHGDDKDRQSSGLVP